ncbi:MAG: AtpZ/AtpI family protein [Actinomycetota bacterium]|nr:AtpZ/AtpI family protein [Actinomycetota bacterium]
MKKQRDSRTERTADDQVGSGIEAGLVMVSFAGLGYLLDRWLGLAPLLTISLFMIGAVGLFYKFRADYDRQIEQLAQERRDGARWLASVPDKGGR